MKRRAGTFFVALFPKQSSLYSTNSNGEADYGRDGGAADSLLLHDELLNYRKVTV